MEINTIEVSGINPAIFSMRNPMNSWDLSDSNHSKIGDKDLYLAQRLIKAGNEHMKFMRMIQVWANFNMPLYWWKEMDLYKFKETNSCSTMHKITSRHLTLEDFEIDSDLEKKVEQKIIIKENPKWIPIKGYEEEYEISDDGRVKNIKRNKVNNIIVDNRGYSKKSLCKNGIIKQFSAHRLVANAFIPNPENKTEVNHIDGNKLNNTVENLEWVTRIDNMIHAHKNGLQHYSGYIQYCNRQKIGKFTDEDIEDIYLMRETGVTHRAIADKYKVSHTTIGSILNRESYKTISMSDLDSIKLTIQKINNLIDLYNDTNESKYFKRIIQMLPSSYIQLRTVNTNYAEIRSIILQRKNHKLKYEWIDTFCRWTTTLPYAKELIYCGIEEYYNEFIL